MLEVTLRDARETDLDGIVALGAEVVEAAQWTRSDYQKAIIGREETDGVARMLIVAESDGELVGFAAAGRVWDEVDLENVAVRAAHRRQGIGRILCEAVVGWARLSSASDLLLEVRAGSAGARALYRSMGFVDEGIRRNYYRDPVDDAVLMRLELAAAAEPQPL